MWKANANHIPIRYQGCEATNPFGKNTCAGIFDPDKRWLAMSLESTPSFKFQEYLDSQAVSESNLLHSGYARRGWEFSIGTLLFSRNTNEDSIVIDRSVSASLGRIKLKPQTELCPILQSQFNPAKASADNGPHLVLVHQLGPVLRNRWSQRISAGRRTYNLVTVRPSEAECIMGD